MFLPFSPDTEGRASEIVAEVHNFQLPRVHGDRCTNEQIFLLHSINLAPLEEDPPVFQVVLQELKI